MQDRSSWGAVPDGNGVWRFAIWQPSATDVRVRLHGRHEPMARGDGGVFHARLKADAGDVYGFVVDGTVIPDPASRAQAGGVDDPSCLIDASAYPWSTVWQGRPWHEAVIYEMHIGTLTPEGTFRAAAARLRDLAALGITAIEIMPVAQFSGDRGWGYDGVLPYAPHNAYGSPDDLRSLIDTAHALGLMVFLDVVYNHFGAEGNRLPPEFFDEARHTPWGRGIDFSQPAVRQFFADNAVMWLTDYRLDGLRFDAVHQMADSSDPEFLVELAQTLRALDLGRPIHLITEDERNLPYLRQDGLYDAEWNDDYHHAIHVLLTGESHGYYAPFAVDPMADLVAALTNGQVRQGQDRGSDDPPGARVDHLPWTAFVNANQTHDQIGNRPQGDRLTTLAKPEAIQTAMALLLLTPFIPMLFMGEEVGDRAPFQFFADFTGDLAEQTRAGRRNELAGISDGANPPDPIAASTLQASRPFTGDPAEMAQWRTLTQTLLALRAKHVIPLLASGRSGDARVVQTGPRSLTAHWPFAAGTLTVHVNLGATPDAAPGTGGMLYSLYDTGTDPYAFSFTVT